MDIFDIAIHIGGFMAMAFVIKELLTDQKDRNPLTGRKLSAGELYLKKRGIK